MSNNISGKVVIITGASSGIGLTTAKVLAAKGAILSLAARRKERLDALVDEITAAGGKAMAFATDVSDRASVERLVAGTVHTFGKIDVLFNNAGVMPISMLESLHYDEWEQMIDVNIKGVLYGIGAARLSSYLSDMLRELTGLNAQQHIHQKLIEKAKEILTTTNRSVGDIAYQLGFEYPQSFNKLFKNKTNVSPLEFRNASTNRQRAMPEFQVFLGANY